MHNLSITALELRLSTICLHQEYLKCILAHHKIFDSEKNYHVFHSKKCMEHHILWANVFQCSLDLDKASEAL